MNAFARRKRAAAAIAAAGLSVAALAGGALSAPAGAAPARTATTYTDTTYLQDTLGLPAGQTVLETVTYERFNWLLQQQGNFAFLVGDPALDANFKTTAQAAVAQAQAHGISKIYWFDPNLSGYSGLRNLDIRNPSGITSLAASSQAAFGTLWTNLLTKYIGDTDAVVNDADAPAFDNRTGATPAVGSSDSFFFAYNKDHVNASSQPDKVLTWVDAANNTADASVTPGAALSDTFAADFAALTGTKAPTAVSQAKFYETEFNRKHDLVDYGHYPTTSADTAKGGNLISDGDAAEWHVQQLTYPELIHLLDHATTQNAVILFGGTWCPNTRAVIHDVNAQAAANNVTVYNFDLVLDGGTTYDPSTTTTEPNTSANPLHIRDNAAITSGGIATLNARPSYLYGDLVRSYLQNLLTEYDPNTGTKVNYYPGGDTTKVIDSVRKLQVPFLIGYQKGIGGSTAKGVARQWIQQNADPASGLPTFKEYMSQWWYTHPAGTRIGLSDSQFPAEIKTIPGLAGFNWQNPTYPSASNTPDSAYQTATEITNSDTSKVAQRRTNVLTALGSPSGVSAGGVAFGQAAIAKLGYFFDGLPGGVTSTQTVTAPSVKYGTAPKITVAIANEYGRVPTGKVSLTVAGKSYPAQTIVANAASFTLPKLAAGSYSYTLSYPGDDQILAFSKTGTLSVAKGSVASVKGATSKKPTSKKAGAEKVTVAAAAGNATATGKVTVTLKKGSAKKTGTATLKSGVATVQLPKLAKGTWTVKLAYAGDANYAASTATGTSVKVTK